MREEEELLSAVSPDTASNITSDTASVIATAAIAYSVASETASANIATLSNTKKHLHNPPPD